MRKERMGKMTENVFGGSKLLGTVEYFSWIHMGNSLSLKSENIYDSFSKNSQGFRKEDQQLTDEMINNSMTSMDYIHFHVFSRLRSD